MALSKAQRSAIGKALISLRRDFSTNTGRPRTIPHQPDNHFCPCRACVLGRKATRRQSRAA